MSRRLGEVVVGKGVDGGKRTKIDGILNLGTLGAVVGQHVVVDVAAEVATRP